MSMLLPVLLFAAGLAVIIKCSDLFVDAACWMSTVTGISRAVIGATIVSFATTAPEYFVSLVGVMKGHYDLSIGNAVGSLSANLGMALAVLAIFSPGIVGDRLFGIKGLIMIFAAGLLLVFCMDGRVSIIEGLILLVIFAVSIFINLKYSKEDDIEEYCPPGEAGRTGKDIALNVGKFVLGAGGIIFGSNLLVDNGVVIAEFLGVSEAVIGLTFIAIGTSLPEIITSVAAIVKKQSAISIGNIVGANIIDTTLILSTGAFLSGGHLAVSATTVSIDLPVTLGLMAIAVLPVLIWKKLFRTQGIVMAAAYISYLVFITVF